MSNKIDNDIKIKFDENNNNSLLFYKKEKLIKILAIPPNKNGCDIININGEEINDGYTHNFKGIIILNNGSVRKLYHNGELIDEIRMW